MNAQSLMNSEHFLLYLIIYIGVVMRLSTGCLIDDIVERFYYTPEKDAGKPLHHEYDAQLELTIVGRRVTWTEAKALCLFYDESFADAWPFDPEAALESPAKMKHLLRETDTKPHNSTLAIFTDDEEANWLAHMLSESNYRYEGLWIGGTRKNKTSGWTWIGNGKSKTSRVSKSILLDGYPSWYHVSSEISSQQNCLLFNKMGHDIPVYMPENCQLQRPFICMRRVKRKLTDKISEGGSLTVDGHHYTLYNVIDHDDPHYVNTGMEKLNGGGITWNDARIECKRRGKELAMVMSNEAAIAIADLMLKNRPSMENVWLGGWSLDGEEWIWEPTGSNLPLTKARSTQYPPWLEGHPLPYTKENYYSHRSSRCLILDRHYCPQQNTPVFLDLDCGKERPFICQDETDEDCLVCESAEATNGRKGFVERSSVRRSTINEEEFEFSEEEMIYEDGQDYCAYRNGRVANIANSKVLSAVLEKMSELSINHVWVGGRTVKKNGKWRWVDSNGNELMTKGVGSDKSWCLGDQNQLPKAEPNSCLNLDYESRGNPLFYGIPCNSSQTVLCISPLGSHAEEVVQLLPDEVETRFLDGFDTSIGKFSNHVVKVVKDVVKTTSKHIDNFKDQLQSKDKGKGPGKQEQSTPRPKEQQTTLEPTKPTVMSEPKQGMPTEAPTEAPTVAPTVAPTEAPTEAPTGVTEAAGPNTESTAGATTPSSTTAIGVESTSAMAAAPSVATDAPGTEAPAVTSAN